MDMPLEHAEFARMCNGSHEFGKPNSQLIYVPPQNVAKERMTIGLLHNFHRPPPRWVCYELVGSVCPDQGVVPQPLQTRPSRQEYPDGQAVGPE
jgi:hypothetical protein